MRIFYGFLILFFSALLWFIPISDNGIYEFRTDAKIDTVQVETGAAETSGNHTLTLTLYNNDTSSVDIVSYEYGDVPAVVSYNSSNRFLVFNGLLTSTNRTLEITYDTDVFSNSNFWPEFLDNFKYFWWVFICLFPIAAIVYMIKDGA